MSGGLSIPVAWATGIVPGFGARRAPAPLWLPSALFAEAQPGIWLDGSDNSVMWQDAAGITPVTALGQPVGLVLDKRLWGGKSFAQVMAEQAELNANPGGPFVSLDGYFASGSAPLVLVDGKIRITTANTIGSKRIEYTLVTTPGKTYRVKFRAASTGIGTPRAVSWTNVVLTPDIYMSPELSDYEAVITATSTSSTLRWYIRSSGDLVTGEYVELASLEISEVPSIAAYQTTSGARPLWQADANGFPGLQFDGVDDFLVTQSIDFSASDKVMVAAGVRKLSDAATGCLLELSSSVNTNNGAFNILNGSGTGGENRFSFTSRGTANAFVGTVDSNFNAPFSAVVTGLGDIGGDLARLRVNGQQAAENTADQGTGNYGNYPLYIGRRAGSTLPYNGFIHQLVVRGGALPDAAELAKLEAYIAGKSGVVL